MDEEGSGARAQALRRLPLRLPARGVRAIALVALSLLIRTVLPTLLHVEALPTPNANVAIEPGPTDARNPHLAVDASGFLHAVRSENKTSPRGAYYSRSLDGGLSWSLTVRVDGSTGNVSFPRIAVEREAVLIRGRANVAYQTEAGPDADVWFASSEDGLSWTAPRRIDNAPPNSASITPSIVATADCWPSRTRARVGRDPLADLPGPTSRANLYP